MDTVTEGASRGECPVEEEDAELDEAERYYVGRAVQPPCDEGAAKRDQELLSFLLKVD